MTTTTDTTTTEPAARPIDATELLRSVSAVAAVLGDGMTAGMVGGSFTCSEAETIAELLFVAGHEDDAARWLLGHVEGDDDPDDDEDHLRLQKVARDATRWESAVVEARDYLRGLA